MTIHLTGSKWLFLTACVICGTIILAMAGLALLMTLRTPDLMDAWRNSVYPDSEYYEANPWDRED